MAPLLVDGTRHLWSADGGRWRPLLTAWLIVLVLTFAGGGRPYYALPFTVLALVAGTMAAEGWKGWARVAAVVMVAASAAVSLPVSLPLVPPSRLAGSPVAQVNEAAAEQTDGGGRANALPPAHEFERSKTCAVAALPQPPKGRRWPTKTKKEVSP